MLRNEVKRQMAGALEEVCAATWLRTGLPYPEVCSQSILASFHNVRGQILHYDIL